MPNNVTYAQQVTAAKIAAITAKNNNRLAEITREYNNITALFSKSANDQLDSLLRQMDAERQAAEGIAALYSALLTLLQDAAGMLDTVQSHYSAQGITNR